ncbi:hypothetical protein [Sorangium sp. So ce1000]|uniref:hypothetical protein n=1 Tax=Sorangium sp. So ce1000 TaxID=3133325 RepID=UPI003F613AED
MTCGQTRGARGPVLRREDAVSLLRDGRVTLDRAAWELATKDPRLALNSSFDRLSEHGLCSLSPQAHMQVQARLQARLGPAFTSRELDRLTPEIRSVVDEPLAAAGGRKDIGEIDAALSVGVDMVSDTIVCPRASAFDLRRGVDKDIAFGGGNHYCIGATLARLEGRFTIDALLGRSRGGARWAA